MNYKKWIFWIMTIILIVILTGVFIGKISDVVGVGAIVSILGYYVWYFKKTIKDRKRN